MEGINGFRIYKPQNSNHCKEKPWVYIAIYTQDPLPSTDMAITFMFKFQLNKLAINFKSFIRNVQWVTSWEYKVGLVVGEG